jgi:outer membrane protein OmpA-like peptidoglycan-associated protein
MIKIVKITLIWFVLLFCNTLLFSQEARQELGDRYFDVFAFKKAIKLYDGIRDKDKDWYVYAKLGDCYYYTAQYKKAEESYKKALEKRKSGDMNIYRIRFAISFLSVSYSDKKEVIDCNEKIRKLDKEMQIILSDYLKCEPEDICKTLSKKEKSDYTTDVHVVPLMINDSISDFGGYIANDVIYFSSTRENPLKSKRLNKQLYNWNDQPYLDFYSASIGSALDEIKWISNDTTMLPINTVAHESSLTISKDGKYMYFSGGEVTAGGKLKYNSRGQVKENGKIKYNSRGTSNLKIKKAIFKDNKWVLDNSENTIIGLNKVNLENYSVSSPALSPDNKRLYFTSCAPYTKAKGQTDIYYVNLDENLNITSKPSNLEHVNSFGREMFPFISEDNILYFSSDGPHENNMGLLDVFSHDMKICEICQEKEEECSDCMEGVNMGSPFNSEKDDFAYFTKTLPRGSDYDEFGFFSSDRDTFVHNKDTIIPKGDDDIYGFYLKRIPEKRWLIKGIVTDAKTEIVLKDATVTLMDSLGNHVGEEVKTDSLGNYSFELDRNKSYKIFADKEEYDKGKLEEFRSDVEIKIINLELTPYPCSITIDDQDDLLFEFDSDSIILSKIPESVIKIIDVLETNDDLKLRIESHTDSRGDENYNLNLSERRAENTRQYLINNGVDPKKIISAKGRGEKCLIYNDDDITSKPPEEREALHKQNRRSVFIINHAKCLEEEFSSCIDNTDD